MDRVTAERQEDSGGFFFLPFLSEFWGTSRFLSFLLLSCYPFRYNGSNRAGNEPSTSLVNGGIWREPSRSPPGSRIGAR